VGRVIFDQIPGQQGLITPDCDGTNLRFVTAKSADPIGAFDTAPGTGDPLESSTRGELHFALLTRSTITELPEEDGRSASAATVRSGC